MIGSTSTKKDQKDTKCSKVLKRKKKVKRVPGTKEPKCNNWLTELQASKWRIITKVVVEMIEIIAILRRILLRRGVSS